MGSDVRHVRGEAQKELVKKFEVFSSNGRSRWQVWSDWITMSAIAVSNATDRSHFDEREKQYLSIAGKYTRPEIRLQARLCLMTKGGCFQLTKGTSGIRRCSGSRFGNIESLWRRWNWSLNR